MSQDTKKSTKKDQKNKKTEKAESDKKKTIKYSVGERQKPVNDKYRKGWESIFNKK